MEAVIFIGTQATGKSTFYRQRFFRTHVRISLDLLRTRYRERLMLDACLKTGQPFVVDNTNPRREDRSLYLTLARAAGFRTLGYYFQSRLADALHRTSWSRGSTAALTGEAVFAQRRRIKTDLELPTGEDYSAFLRSLLGGG